MSSDGRCGHCPVARAAARWRDGAGKPASGVVPPGPQLTTAVRCFAAGEASPQLWREGPIASVLLGFGVGVDPVLSPAAECGQSMSARPLDRSRRRLGARDACQRRLARSTAVDTPRPCLCTPWGRLCVRRAASQSSTVQTLSRFGRTTAVDGTTLEAMRSDEQAKAKRRSDGASWAPLLGSALFVALLLALITSSAVSKGEVGGVQTPSSVAPTKVPPTP